MMREKSVYNLRYILQDKINSEGSDVKNLKYVRSKQQYFDNTFAFTSIYYAKYKIKHKYLQKTYFYVNMLHWCLYK